MKNKLNELEKAIMADNRKEVERLCDELQQSDNKEVIKAITLTKKLFL